jgi:hypothetical protein
MSLKRLKKNVAVVHTKNKKNFFSFILFGEKSSLSSAPQIEFKTCCQPPLPPRLRLLTCEQCVNELSLSANIIVPVSAWLMPKQMCVEEKIYIQRRYS